MNVPSKHGFGVDIPDIAVRPTGEYKKIYSTDMEIRCGHNLERNLSMCDNR
jgi:hypothetical protein